MTPPRTNISPRLLLIALLALPIALAVSVPLGLASGTLAIRTTPTATAVDAQDSSTIEALVQEAIRTHDEVLGFAVYDVAVERIEFSSDRDQAIAWLQFLDRDRGHVVPTEPGMALARRSGNGWEVFLQVDETWPAALEALPDDLLSPDARASWLARAVAQQEALNVGPFGGYRLPWRAGLTKFLTRSISHGIGGSMHYAFDFAEPGYPSDMFAVHAAKGGLVRFAQWIYPNGYYDGNCSHSNYLVIEHPTTSPPTYTLYMHLAQNSIPPELRVPGAPVAQGQFIGYADDTGCSSGNHLHLQTHLNPNSYWGTSVDITFDDVPINGGRPRTPTEAQYYPAYGAEGQWLYTSGNTGSSDTTLPLADLQTPVTGQTITTASLPIAGWATDFVSGLDHAQVVARYNGTWHEVGPPRYTTTFAFDWDLCADAVPDGPISLGVNVWDRGGNLALTQGLTHIVKNRPCPPPPPTCAPGPGEVALFSETNFKGACTLLATGNYSDSTTLGDVGEDDSASIQLGNSVMATLYSESAFGGRAETLISSDRNLEDNQIGADILSSLSVVSAASSPDAPQLIWPAPAQVYSQTQIVSLVWRDGGGATQFQARISGAVALTTPWQTAPAWLVSMLPPGSYTWQVRARNASGASSWSPGRSLEVQAAAVGSGLTITAPFSDDLESGPGDWNASGLWHLADDPGKAHSGAHSWWFGDEGSGTFGGPNPNLGALTSPPITIPGPGYALHFWYRYETESAGTHWDQRRVQVLGPSGEVLQETQLFDDVPNVWLQSPPILLDPYAGQTIQVRFLFATLDEMANDYQGWMVDDLEVAPYTEPTCQDANEPNPSPQTATLLTYGAPVTAAICPPGDIDYYTFQGQGGERVVADIDAAVNGSPLDSYLDLLDADGTSLLASNDDEILYQRTDSHLGFELPADGTYYLKVRAWNHPGVGSPDHVYTLTLTTDSTPPTIQLTSPQSGSYLAPGQVTVQVNASDAGSGISRVEFLWHAGDWLSAAWQLLGEDRDGSDGWSATLDTNGLPDQNDLGFFARAYDWAGNQMGAGVWEVGIDHSPPVSNLDALPPSHGSTAVRLTWQGDDPVAGIDHYDIQINQDLGGWQDWQTDLSPTPSAIWFIGQQDRLYNFRIRAVDRAGNVETYPADGDTLTYIPSCASPDAFEPDDTPGTAAILLPDGTAQEHNFCQPGDEDWVVFAAEGDQHYRLTVAPLEASTAAHIRLYAPDGVTLLAESAARGFGQSSALSFIAPQQSLYYLRISHIDSAVAGDAVGYRLWITPGYASHLPRIHQ